MQIMGNTYEYYRDGKWQPLTEQEYITGMAVAMTHAVPMIGWGLVRMSSDAFQLETCYLLVVDSGTRGDKSACVFMGRDNADTLRQIATAMEEGA